MAAAGDMVLDEGHDGPVAAVAHHSRSLMIWDDLLMKSFAGFPLQVAMWWPLEVFRGMWTLQLSGRCPQSLVPLLDDKDSHSMDLKGINLRPIILSLI